MDPFEVHDQDPGETHLSQKKMKKWRKIKC